MDKVPYCLVLYGMFFIFCQCGREQPRLQYDALGFLHPLERAAIARNKISAIFVVNPLNPLTGETNDTLWMWRFDTRGNFISGWRFWHGEMYEYDSLNRVTQSHYLSCFLETACYTYHRSGDDLVIRVDTVRQDSSGISFNQQGLPLGLSHISGTQYSDIAFTYDQQGMLTGKVITNPVNISSPFSYFNALPFCMDSHSELRYDYLISEGNLETESCRYLAVCEKGDTVVFTRECRFNEAGLRAFLIVSSEHKIPFQYRHHTANR
jgi:hypothetical protein